ncbi:hypothetical protein B0T20DRAFT_399971 [Sordaria brevicollis]|uniref:Secreted protein n=1 Tax=Sordaria brevicollis TaxID=83679 RepID=A0AAE0PN14_SORBR|nr:hypothetical protein B0T20DRAFT_399971 [Sordaria brevicollis]
MGGRLVLLIHIRVFAVAFGRKRATRMSIIDQRNQAPRHLKTKKGMGYSAPVWTVYLKTLCILDPDFLCESRGDTSRGDTSAMVMTAKSRCSETMETRRGKKQSRSFNCTSGDGWIVLPFDSR